MWHQLLLLLPFSHWFRNECLLLDVGAFYKHMAYKSNDDDAKSNRYLKKKQQQNGITGKQLGIL